MSNIGIRNLKFNTSSIIRNVSKKKMSYIVTCYGHPVGLLSPIEPVKTQNSSNSQLVWEKLESLNSTIASAWKSKKSAVEILSEMRR